MYRYMHPYPQPLKDLQYTTNYEKKTFRYYTGNVNKRLIQYIKLRTNTKITRKVLWQKHGLLFISASRTRQQSTVHHIKIKNCKSRVDIQYELQFIDTFTEFRGSMHSFVRLPVTPLLQLVQNQMCKENKGNQPERKLEAQENAICSRHQILLYTKIPNRFTIR